MTPLYLVDGSGYIFRAFYAIAPLTNSKGLPTNALYGFTRMVVKLLRDVHAEHVAVAFDTGRPTFRHEMYDQYKANRKECPPELSPQLPYFRKIVEALGVQCLSQEGVEADDIIGTIALEAAKAGQRVVIVSGDKDLTQLVSDNIEVWDAMRDVRFVPAMVKEKFGVLPAQIIDYLTLVGDTSDNVPGVKGIGPKTAVALLEHFGSVEHLMNSLSEVGELKGLRGAKGVAEKLESARDMIRLSRDLVTLNTGVASFLGMSEGEGFQWRGPQPALLAPLFTELEFESLLDSLPQGAGGAVLASVSSAPAPEKRFELVTAESLERWMAELATVPEFAIDTETTSLDPHSAELVGISLSWRAGEAIFIPLGSTAEPERNVSRERVHDLLGPILKDPARKKIACHAKFDLNILRSAGFEVEGVSFDPMLASYVLHPDRRQHSLAAMTKTYLHEEMTEYKELVGKRGSIAEVELAEVTQYACHDAEATFQLKAKLDPLFGPPEEVETPSPRRVLQVLELPLVPVLAEMEWVGIKVDVPFLGELESRFSGELAALEAEVYTLAGGEFNLNSPKQLSEVLFSRLAIPTAGVKKTQTAYSTDASVLNRLVHHHPVIEPILEYRELFKLKTTYIDSLRRLVHPKTHRIHTSFNQTVAATGRLSSSEPNLQNIPIRNERGRQLRKAFIAEPGSVLIAADYSQIELRLLAHLSGDETLQKAFHADEDIHAATARQIFGLVSESEFKELRRVAKTINFGVLYGMGAFRLAEELGVPRKQAQEYIDNYFGRYPRVKRYFQTLLEQAERSGYVETLFGRRRYLQDIDTSGRDAGHAARSLNNAPIQGSAADIIKLAMIHLSARLQSYGERARLVLQVHDELVVEAEAAIAEEIQALVQREMSHAVQLAVPLRVELHLAHSWG